MFSPERAIPSIYLEKGWERIAQKDGSFLYHTDRLPLGWILRYSADGLPYFHDTIRHFCTRDDPRQNCFQKSHTLRRAETHAPESGSVIRSLTIPQSSNSFEEFYHKPLGSATSIRLLKWMGRDEAGVPSFAVEEHDIERTPPYVALSYTWGNPFRDLDQQAAGNSYGIEYQWPILCDGKIALVRKNLHDFLQQNDLRYDNSNDVVGGGSALHYAAFQGRVDKVTDLLRIGADIDGLDAMSRTPLFLACAAEHKQVVDVLLTHGANTELRTSPDTYPNTPTPLHFSVVQGNADIAGALIDAGADMEARNKPGGTPLHMAVLRKKHGMVSLLLAKGANINAFAPSPPHGETPLHVALSEKDMVSVRLLVEHKADINATNTAGRTPLHYAAEEDDVEITRHLLQHGGNPNIKSFAKGWTPLHTATAHGPLETMMDLLDAGAELEAVEDELGRTPLLLACEFDRPEHAKCLLERGAEIDRRRTEDQCTALHMASWRMSPSLVKELLDRGANAHLTDSDGQTALFKAVGQPLVPRHQNLEDEEFMERIATARLEVISLLLKHGVEVNVADSKGFTPLHCSAASKTEKAAVLFLEAGARVRPTTDIGNTPLLSAAAAGNTEMVRLLLRWGANIDEKNVILSTALHLACRSSADETARLLIQLGADVNGLDADNETPLYEAVSVGSEECVRLCMEHGANTAVQNNNGQTAIDLAARLKMEDIYQLLLDWGAKPSKVPMQAGIAKSAKDEDTAPSEPPIPVGDNHSGPAVDIPPSSDVIGSHTATPPSPYVAKPGASVKDGAEILAATVQGAKAVATQETLDLLDARKPRGKVEYIWVDALAINQADEVEKRTQVNLMSRIYRTANFVHVWLGLEDDHTKLASSTLRKIVGLHATKYKGLSSNYDPDLAIWWHLKNEGHVPEKVLVYTDDETIEMPTADHKWLISLEEWNSFDSLIHRQWFERVWTLQEVSLAKHVQVSCGAQNIVWQDLYRALMILTPIRDVFARGPYIWKRTSEGTTAFVSAELHSRLQPGEDYALTNMSAIVAWNKSSELPLVALVLLTWGFKASDPRDKIYALLGLAQDVGRGHSIQPDYQRSGRDVFMEVTQLLIDGFDKIDEPLDEVVEISKKDIPELAPLEILGFASYERNDLPSWTPNFGASLPGYRLWYPGYSPAGSATPEWSFPRPGIFRARGVFLERIVQLEESPDSFEAHDLNRFIYWLHVLPEILNDKDNSTFNILGTCLTVFRSSDRFRFTPGMAWTAMVAFFRHCALRRIIFERDLEHADPSGSTHPQHNLLNWRHNWDRLAAAEESHALPTILELEDELRDPEIEKKVMNTTLPDLYRQARAMIAPLNYYMKQRVLFRAQYSDNIGIVPRAARPGDFLFAIAGAASLFAVRYLQEDPEEWVIIGEAFMPSHRTEEGRKVRFVDFR